jgi:pimeloyl-ACP methyl ester carboxylesterase
MWIIPWAVVALGFLFFWSGPSGLSGRTATGINTLEAIELNGSEQWISIRATDAGHPVLLLLHGGPGSANLALLHQQMPKLEHHFIVVTWDQRGAGKSVQRLDNEPLSIAQMQADKHALVQYLKARFGVKKIYLVGFSWGTELGLSYASQYPKNLYAYIGVSLFVNALEAETLSLDYTRRIAREQNNQAALNELATIDPTTYTSPTGLAQIQIQRKWLLKFGGVYHTHDNYNHEILSILAAPEYSLVDFIFWPKGSSHSLKQLYPEVLQINFFDSIPRVDVPVYFLVGRYDYNTPFALVERYYAQLDAPSGKQLVWFDESAHSTHGMNQKNWPRRSLELSKAWMNNHYRLLLPKNYLRFPYSAPPELR